VGEPLHTYLADHLAGATFGLALVRRCHGKNEGSAFEKPLGELVREIELDRATLIAVMAAVGAKPSRTKTWAAWILEKARRLKPNGRPLRDTLLSRLLELEILSIGITVKRALWRALEEVGLPDRTNGFDFRRLAERAEAQLDAVEAMRLQAARDAFGSGRPAPDRVPPL
jgi:hypothetical protein